MPIPSSPDLITTAFANAGDKTAPPQTDPDGFVNFAQGYGPDYEIDLSSGDTAAKAVERKIQNYLFYLLTGVAKSWQGTSIAPWYSGMPSGYPKGAIVGRVSFGGTWQVWRSLVEGNVVDPNAASQTSWEYIPFNMELLKSVPMPGGGIAQVQPGGQATELVSVATDFNTFVTGTWEFTTDTAANGSAHSPVALGGSSAFAGMLEAKTWTAGANTYAIQRYCDRTGLIFTRGATNGTWSAWTSAASASSSTSYSLDTGTVNAVQGNALLSSGTIADNQAFWVKIANANTGAATFSPNTTVGAAPLLGQDYGALQGGELVVGGRILVVYSTSAASYILVSNVGGRLPAVAAAHDNQAVNFAQMNTALGLKFDKAGGSIGGNVTLTAGSIFVSAGNVTALNMTAGSYNSPTANWIAGTTGAGNMYFRPNGIGSSTGQMSLSNAGNLSVAGDIACLGASFGSNIAASATDLSQHIDLYGGIVGLSVTAGHLNYVVNSTSNHNWYTGTTNPMTLDVNGLLTVQSVKTVGALTSSGNIFLDSGAINDRYVYVYTNGVARWRFGGTGGGESGGNTGTDWALTSFNDAGGFLASAMMVTRATSAVTFAGTGNFQGSDVRLKKNIQKSAARPLHRDLTLCNYELISNGAKARGILAQDLQRSGPEYVSEADIGGTPDKPLKRLTVNYQGTALEIAIWAAQEVDRINARARMERWVLGGTALAFGLIALAARAL